MAYAFAGPSPLAALVAAPAAAPVAVPSAAFRADSVFTMGRFSSPSQHRWGPDYSARVSVHPYKRPPCLRRLHDYSRPRPLVAAAAAGTPVASELPWPQRRYQLNQAQEAQRVMAERKLDAHGQTFTARLEIIVAKQAAAALARRNSTTFCTAATSHSLPGSDIGLNCAPNIGPQPISTDEGSFGGHSSERVPPGSAVMVSQASDEERAQGIAPSVEHANGAMSRQKLMPEVLKPADVVVDAPHPWYSPLLTFSNMLAMLAGCCKELHCISGLQSLVGSHPELVEESFVSGSAALIWLQTVELAVCMNRCIWLLTAQRAYVCYEDCTFKALEWYGLYTCPAQTCLEAADCA